MYLLGKSSLLTLPAVSHQSTVLTHHDILFLTQKISYLMKNIHTVAVKILVLMYPPHEQLADKLTRYF